MLFRSADPSMVLGVPRGSLLHANFHANFHMGPSNASLSLSCGADTPDVHWHVRTSAIDVGGIRATHTNGNACFWFAASVVESPLAAPDPESIRQDVVQIQCARQEPTLELLYDELVVLIELDSNTFRTRHAALHRELRPEAAQARARGGCIPASRVTPLCTGTATQLLEMIGPHAAAEVDLIFGRVRAELARWLTAGAELGPVGEAAVNRARSRQIGRASCRERV